MEYVLFTDGACQPNPGTGGWAFILLLDEKEVLRQAGAVTCTTNNRMELLAVLNGMTAFLDLNPSDDRLNICSDSMYLINGIRNWSKKWQRSGWMRSDKKPVLNKDLWEKIRNLADRIDLSYTHIKGHAGNYYNELVDRLAVEIIKKHGLLSSSGD